MPTVSCTWSWQLTISSFHRGAGGIVSEIYRPALIGASEVNVNHSSDDTLRATG